MAELPDSSRTRGLELCGLPMSRCLVIRAATARWQVNRIYLLTAFLPRTCYALPNVMKHVTRAPAVSVLLLCVAAWLLLPWPLSAQSASSPVLPPAAAQEAYPFFPFCIDWHDAKKRNFAEQARMLKELGYPGVGHIWLDGVAERLKTLDDAGLKLFQITMTVLITPGKPALRHRALHQCPVAPQRAEGPISAC